MKKLIVVMLAGLVVIGFSVNGVYAQEDEAVMEQQVAVKQEVVKQEPVTEAFIAKKKAELNGTEWNIKMMPMGGVKGKHEMDVISFADDKVVSKNLQKLGFEPSNFTVRIQEDGAVTWETMQSSEKEGMAFWRGDLKDGLMTGVLSKRDKADKGTDYSFSSVVAEVK